MFTIRKTVFTIVFVTAVFIVGFIFLLRGCLSKYDERSALLPVLYFEKNDSPVVFSIVLYSRATSYSQQGGFTQKTVSSDYFIQSNDGRNGVEWKKKKVKNHSEIKNYPVEIIGASQHKAWLFIGELMAFDPFTLEKIADTAILAKKNPSLANRFPAERKYYVFNELDSTIYFTATDGTKWKLATSDLSIASTESKLVFNSSELLLKKIQQLEKQNQARQDSNYQRNNEASSLYSEGKISRDIHNKMIAAYYSVREKLAKQRDSLQQLKNDIGKTERQKNDQVRAIENLKRINAGYYSIKTNTDSVNKKWYGLYSDQEFEKLNKGFSYNSENDETSRRKLFTAGITVNSPDEAIINKDEVVTLSNETFLHGGFLLDKKTAAPVHLHNAWLVVSKEQVGREGKTIVSAVSFTGKSIWSFNTQLREWLDWLYTGSHLYIFGNDNSKVSGTGCTVMWCIDLSTGHASRYDYFNTGKN